MVVDIDSILEDDGKSSKILNLIFARVSFPLYLGMSKVISLF